MPYAPALSNIDHRRKYVTIHNMNLVGYGSSAVMTSLTSNQIPVTLVPQSDNMLTFSKELL
jgi:hypothetical protein